MTKAELLEKLAAVSGVSTEDADKVLNSLSDIAADHISEGFSIPGFGTFRLVAGEERTVQNPFKPGEHSVFRLPASVEFIVNSEAEARFRETLNRPSVASRESQPNRSLPAVRLVPSDEDARDIEGINANSCCKLGGFPDWIQGSETPTCCGWEMQFYGQLDSIGGEFCLGDVGMIYVFYCENCCSTRSIFQCH